MKNLTLLFLILLSTCASAQIDSTYQIGYPYKVEVTYIGGTNFSRIFLVEITRPDIEVQKFCRVSTANYAVSSTKFYKTLLNKPQTEALIKKINDWYRIGQGGNPEIYTEYVDLIQGDRAHLNLSYYSPGQGKNWALIMDADRFLKRGRSETKGVNEMKKLNDGLKKCLSML